MSPPDRDPSKAAPLPPDREPWAPELRPRLAAFIDGARTVPVRSNVKRADARQTYHHAIQAGETIDVLRFAPSQKHAQKMIAELRESRYRQSIKTKRQRPARLVFLFDVDNTLLDNDRVTKDIRQILVREVGRARANRYWEFFEARRSSLGYADYLGALQSYRREYPHDIHLLKLSRFLIEYDFRKRLFPDALKVLKHMWQHGRVAIVSDGDVVFQPRKIECCGLMEAVRGNVFIYVHKERELSDIAKRLPASHYVVVDDKIRILTAIKRKLKRKVTTVFVRQGHYALDQKLVAKYPPADVSIDRIGDLMKCDVNKWQTR